MNNILGQTTKAQIKKALKALPSGLGENLLLTIERIKSQNPHTKTRANLALTVLMWLARARRPLTVRELQHAVATDPEGRKLGDITNSDFFVDCCFGLVVIDETLIISLVHFSVSEFLEERCDELFKSPDLMLATSCLSYMLLFVKSSDYLKSKTNSTETYPNWPFLDYAIRYWGMHAKIDRTQSDFRAVMDSKAQEFCSSPSALEFWAHTSKDKSDGMAWGESEDWPLPFQWEYVTLTLSKIHIAAIYGLTSLVQDEVDNRPTSIGRTDENGATPLMLAAAGGYLDIVELLMSNSHIDVNAQDKFGKTALWYAVAQEQWSTVQQILNWTGALDINLGEPFRRLCEIWSPHARESRDILSLFLTRDDLDVNFKYYHTDYEPWVRLCHFL
jgi:hypothetical protein